MSLGPSQLLSVAASEFISLRGSSKTEGPLVGTNILLCFAWFHHPPFDMMLASSGALKLDPVHRRAETKIHAKTKTCP